MKLLFLRGQVPKDRDPKQITFNDIESCDDMWTQLALEMSSDDGYGEVLYWGGKRKVRYRGNFVERWVPSLKKHKLSFTPDVIFARGGFPEYEYILKRFKKSYKIYYGAGKRFFPQNSNIKYDLILVDSDYQKEKVQKRFPKIRVELFIKPASDNIFKPKASTKKKYDVIFIGNLQKKDIKGHGFILDSLHNDFSVLQVGITNKKMKRRYPNVKFTGWIPRIRIPDMYAMSRVSVVASVTKDSCPRVIAESIACDCPLVILDSVKFWSKKYITRDTGILTDRENFVDNTRKAVSMYTDFSPNKYYRKNLSLSCAALFIKNLIKK